MRQSIDRPFVIAVMLVTAIFFVLPFWLGAPSAAALTNPCAADPNNLIANGSMFGPGRAVSPYGIVADGWNPFTIGETHPMFEWVNNENANGDVASGSQYIWEDIYRFDAGIYQTVPNLEPGASYHFWIGFALAAYDPGDMVNHRGDWIGRQVGYDLTGGTNPEASTVTWGDVFCDGNAALNIPALAKTFTATTDRATIFLRAINAKEAWIRNKVWFDSVCMERTTAAFATQRAPSDLTRMFFLPFIRVSPPEVPTSCLAGITSLNPMIARSRLAAPVTAYRRYTP